MQKDKRCFGAGLLLLVATAALQMAARHITGFPTWYAHHVYPVLVGVIGRFFGIFPFSVVEIGIYLLLFYCIVYVARFWRKPWQLASRGVLLVGALLFAYTCNCGINYYAVSFSEYAGIGSDGYTKEDLVELCEYLVGQVNETATGESYGKKGGEGGKNSRIWREEATRAMEAASREWPGLGGFYPKPKEVSVSWILSVQQLCGIYSPFTIEANFNGDMPDYNIPHTLCHELSHLKGFMREDEANFIGYLACVGSKRQAFRYSGYLTGWVYAGNALAQADPERYWALSQRLCDQAKEDLQENNAFWGKYEGKVAKAANQVNDAYLKMNDQKDGVRSYGRMVDLMLGYFRDKLP